MDPSEIKNIDSLTITIYGLIAYSTILKGLVVLFFNKFENERVERMKERDLRIAALENENALLKERYKLKHHEA